MAQNITRNIPGTSFSSKAAKYRAMAASASPATSTIAPQPQQSIASVSGGAFSMASSSLSQRSLYNTRAQLRTQKLIEEQKRLEEERIKQLVSSINVVRGLVVVIFTDCEIECCSHQTFLVAGCSYKM